MLHQNCVRADLSAGRHLIPVFLDLGKIYNTSDQARIGVQIFELFEQWRLSTCRKSFFVWP
jgi:hypothetical protein